MSEYLSSFIIDPLARQARRLGRISSGEEHPGFLPTVPESLRTWYPARLWNVSPSPSICETEDPERQYSQPGEWVEPWPQSMPPLPPESMDAAYEPASQSRDEETVTDFPPLGPSSARSAPLEQLRVGSDLSLDPSRDLPDPSRRFEDFTRGHSQSDPTASISTNPASGASRTGVDVVSSSVEQPAPVVDGSGILPEDDGMGPLRQKISRIWEGPSSSQEKSQRIHRLMMEKYRNAQFDNARKRRGSSTPQEHNPKHPLVTASVLTGSKAQPGESASRSMIEEQAVCYNLTPSDLIPTYAPAEPLENEDLDTGDEPVEPEFGCKHYKRNVKLQCNSCRRWYACRLCHDEVEAHDLPRQETKSMLCMFCNTAQAASQVCKMCGVQAACYYCSICKLWNNDPGKAIYHCVECGICRLGQGLGKDFFHCKTCVVCIAISAESTHRCIEQSTKCNCPICGEYLFTSATSVVFMRCGHPIHEDCFKPLCKTGYKCPICSKSILNMETQFRNRQIASQPMPEEYCDTKAYVYCNDCASKCMTDFHWLGLKCAACDSYNTTMLGQPVNANGTASPTQNLQPVAEVLDIGLAVSGDVADEAVTIPSSRAASRRPSPAISDINTTTESPWQLPLWREARSASPQVANYFGLERRDQPVSPSAATLDDEDLDFWGRQSPRHEESSDEGESEGDESSSDEEMTEYGEGDDDDEEDQMDIFGHR